MERFWSKVEKTDTCWNWTACTNRDGYGQFGMNARVRLAHVVSYLLLVGEIPEGKEIDHLCRNRSCVNPGHLEAVDHKTNMLRGLGVGSMNIAKTECDHGHPFTPENTYRRPDGTRDCRRCIVARVKAYRQRKAA